MTVYESLITEDKQPSCLPPNPCCEEPCDEPSFWDLLPQCRLNWIALGLVALAIGFGLIGLGAINVGTVANLSPFGSSPNPTLFDPTTLAQGTRFITIVLGVIALTAWIFFKACNDDWGIVVVGSLVGASAFPLAAVGLIYITVAELVALPASFNRTWFNIAIALIILSIASFLFLAYLLYYSPCRKCVSAKKGVIVSLIFLLGGFAAYSLGRLLWVAVITYQYYVTLPTSPPHPPFPASAFETFIFVSFVNIVLVVALGWYILDCAVENCYFTFLPLFASAASLGNWALYRVGLNIIGTLVSNGTPTLAPLPADTPYTQFAIAIGLLSITALVLTFALVKCDNNIAALIAASSIPLLYAIATYTNVATAHNLASNGRHVNDILIGIFSAIGITAAIDFLLRCSATCPIPTIIYGFASGSFGWAIIYLYSTYSASRLDPAFFHTTDPATLTTGLNVVLGITIISILFIRFFACDELLSALTLLNIALLTVGVGGFFGTLAYYLFSPLNAPDVAASKAIYAIFALAALFLPLFFASCEGSKRRLVIAVAALSAGIAAVDFGRAVVFARAIAFGSHNLPNVTFSTLVYIAGAVGTAFTGQIIVWLIPESNIYTALLASFMGLIVSGISLMVTFFVGGVDFNPQKLDFELIGTPWLIFTFVLVALLVLLQIKSSCIPQSCRFSVGLLIPALSIAVVGKVAGASAALGSSFGFAFNPTPSFLATFAVNSRLILLNSVIPLAAFFVSLKIFNCSTCLAYLPTSIAFTAIVYAVSQFELISFSLISSQILDLFIPFLNRVTDIYFDFDFGTTIPGAIPAYATFITQVNLVYLLFIAPALIVGFVLACFKRVSAAVIGTAIAATAVSLGAIGIANVISGVLDAILAFLTTPIRDLITKYITFANFLEGIQSQFILLAVGVLTIWFIYSGKCRYNRC